MRATITKFKAAFRSSEVGDSVSDANRLRAARTVAGGDDEQAISEPVTSLANRGFTSADGEEQKSELAEKAKAPPKVCIDLAS